MNNKFLHIFLVFIIINLAIFNSCKNTMAQQVKEDSCLDIENVNFEKSLTDQSFYECTVTLSKQYKNVQDISCGINFNDERNIDICSYNKNDINRTGLNLTFSRCSIPRRIDENKPIKSLSIIAYNNKNATCKSKGKKIILNDEANGFTILENNSENVQNTSKETLKEIVKKVSIATQSANLKPYNNETIKNLTSTFSNEINKNCKYDLLNQDNISCLDKIEIATVSSSVLKRATENMKLASASTGRIRNIDFVFSMLYIVNEQELFLQNDLPPIAFLNQKIPNYNFMINSNNKETEKIKVMSEKYKSSEIKAGDVPVWSYGNYGHIAFCVEPNTFGCLVYESIENDDNITEIRKRYILYKEPFLFGWFRKM